MEVSYCDLEQGSLLGDDDEEEKERLIESLMDSIKSKGDAQKVLEEKNQRYQKDKLKER